MNNDISDQSLSSEMEQAFQRRFLALREIADYKARHVLPAWVALCRRPLTISTILDAEKLTNCCSSPDENIEGYGWTAIRSWPDEDVNKRLNLIQYFSICEAPWPLTRDLLPHFVTKADKKKSFIVDEDSVKIALAEATQPLEARAARISGTSIDLDLREVIVRLGGEIVSPVTILCPANSMQNPGKWLAEIALHLPYGARIKKL